MPTIEVSYNDLCKLVGKKIPLEELKERSLWQAKAEFENATKQGNYLRMTLKPADTNRPDLWSAEGIARVLRAYYGKGGLPQYKMKRSGITVKADVKVKRVRPYTVCAVVRGLKITEEVLLQSIQLQEKVAGTFGRGRRDVAIGIYDLSRIKPPIYYTAAKPDELAFVPLEFKQKLTLREILKQHPKGKEFGHLLADAEEYPVFIDSDENVLSMPPIVNSDFTGKVTTQTRDVFIECSGFDMKRLKTALNIVALALADRGGRLETVDVFIEGKKFTTPDLTPKQIEVDVAYARSLSGLDLNAKEFAALLKKQLYDVTVKGAKLAVSYPSFRQDIMHPCDVVEDAIIAYGYENLSPIVVPATTKGSLHPTEAFTSRLEEILVGLGLQQVASYTLTNKRFLFERMNVGHAPVAEIANPQSENWSCFRNSLLPSILEFLAANRHVEYPHEVFEIGDCVLLNESTDTKTRDVRKLAVALTDVTIAYERIASMLDALMRNLGLAYVLKRSQHNSFTPDRVAEVVVNGHSLGYIGEIHPQVLNNWGLEKPVVAFEIDVDRLSANT
ncbi:MAG: phenylalanine--tRNA ligase subunit beta [Candidatus Aenigmatarchaeota archaeon]|nr:MAG: phenylalanine--tRNA ligase subunit beta [Candidatus Aenigmarchaeota archaeon]